MYIKRLGGENGSDYKLLKIKDLKPATRFKYQRLLKFINHAYHRCHLKTPHVFLADSSDDQLAGTMGATLLIVYLGSLLDESPAALHAGVYHEIGHHFVEKIVKEHHLYTPKLKGWKRFYNALGQKPRPKVCWYGFLLSDLFLVVSFFIKIPFLTIMLSILVIVLSALSMISAYSFGHRIDHWIKVYRQLPYRRLSEIVADEFALKMTHSIRACIESLYTPYFSDVYSWRQLVKSCNRLDPEAQKSKDTSAPGKAVAKIYKYDILEPGKIHPAVRYRIARLQRFQNSHYTAW